MKKFLLVCFSLFLSFSALSYDNVIYLSNKKKFKVNKADQALATLIKKSSRKPILFLVHGRGKHPGKGLNLLPKIEKRYNVQVMMFHWDSWISRFTRPVANAKEAGKDLFEALSSINSYKRNNPKKFKRIKLSLMTHSMGAIVFESMLKENDKNSLSKELFENVIINQADSLTEGHSKTLAKTNFQKNLYITYNRNDFSLLGSMALDPGVRLGLGVHKLESYYSFVKVKLLSQATYIDLSLTAERRHRTYLLPSDNMQYRNINNFYFQVLGSEKMVVSDINGIYKKDISSNEKIYEIR